MLLSRGEDSMLTFGFLSDLNPVVAGGIKVGIILAVTIVVVLAARRMIPKLVQAHIPKIREEHPAQLAERSNTLSGAGHLEVHVSQVVFHAKDITEDGVVVAFLDESHGDTGHRRLYWHTGIHEC